MGRFWHRVVLRHSIIVRRATPPMWDLSASGYLFKCSCGEVWTL